MSRQKKDATLNPRKKSRLLTSILTKNSHFQIKAKIRSLSMLPLLVPGMEVILDSKEPHCGDVVCFYAKDKKKIIAHRVLDIDKKAKVLILKGDNRQYIERIKYNEVIGRIKAIILKDKTIYLDSFPLRLANFVLFILSKITYWFPVLTHLIRGRRFLVRLFTP